MEAYPVIILKGLSLYSASGYSVYGIFANDLTVINEADFFKSILLDYGVLVWVWAWFLAWLFGIVAELDWFDWLE